ncbi:unnamed protein product [Caenorhabditis bovis]|uniref:C2H2-type domain-containing protein n=1 Tax=Caenorhabditis bovis TaxID=2654633 RepID=A0A8S1EQN4_9PELO|nr:unnamed protein product [Caenorhabditis bovis]
MSDRGYTDVVEYKYNVNNSLAANEYDPANYKMEQSPIPNKTEMKQEEYYDYVAQPQGYGYYDDEDEEDDDDKEKCKYNPYYTDQKSVIQDQKTTVHNLGKEDEPKKKCISGVGELLTMLRNKNKPAPQKERIILDQYGLKIVPRNQLPKCRIAEVQQRVVLSDSQDGFDLPLLHDVPTDVRVVRKLIRQKMLRCKKCKNRFIEKNIYERHLRDKHPKDYAVYIQEQEEEVETQRLEEIEANRIEELTSGGFIPPENEIDNNPFDYLTEGIPLPGENYNNYAPRYDNYGNVKHVKRPYRKKVSPQCPFCDKRFRNEFSLKKHFAKKHEEMGEFQQCIKCYKCVQDDEEMKNHECELTYVCFECNPIRNLVTDQRLLNHRRKFHRGVNSGFKCSFCNMKFLTPRKLRKHKKMAHVFTKTFQCHFCEEIFISEVGVMTHERVHTGIIKFECKVCDFKANRFIQMEEHMKNEHGYVCSICHTRVAEWSDLKHHTLTDHGGYLASDRVTGHIESPRLWILYKGE